MRESVQVKPVLRDTWDNILDEYLCKTIWKTISLLYEKLFLKLGMSLLLMTNTRDIDWKYNDRVILKFKDRKLKHSIQINRKVLKQKFWEISQF